MTSDTQAKLAGRKLDPKVGIDDELARRLYDSPGSEHVGIVYLRAGRQEHDVDTGDTIVLRVTNIELARDPRLAEALREIARSLYRGRVPVQLDIDSTLDDVEPGADETIEDAKRIILCPICTHARADARIDHGDVEQDDTFCMWRAAGVAVEVGHDEPPTE